LILVGRKTGASVKTLAELTNLSSSAISRRHDAVQKKLGINSEVKEQAEKIERRYRQR
jgi:ABC-type Na+ transport system ATPase subunit NatA